MKNKKQSPKLPQNINLKTSTSNLFLNIIILLLGVFIIFMSYSLVIKIKNNSTGEDSISNRKKVSTIQVEVLNGCGVSGVAENFTSYLRKHKFDVVQMGNYISFNIENTLIVDRTGNKQNAYKVANALGVSRNDVIQQINKDYFLDVSVIIGKDYNQLKPNNNKD